MFFKTEICVRREIFFLRPLAGGSDAVMYRNCEVFFLIRLNTLLSLAFRDPGYRAQGNKLHRGSLEILERTRDICKRLQFFLTASIVFGELFRAALSTRVGYSGGQ